MENQWERTALLIGEEGLSRLREKHVAVFGIGGVGSWCTEALARAGVGHLTLIDRDTVSLSNLNRQLIALHSTVGQPKVLAMKMRLLDINPELCITCHEVFYTPENAADFPLSGYDYIVDAVDTVTAKLTLIERAVQAGVPIISSMGTGNKLDPCALRLADLADTDICPLARVMRRELRRRGIEHLRVLYSTEPPLTPRNRTVSEPGAPRKKDVPGSIAFVPSSAGLLIASEIVRTLLK